MADTAQPAALVRESANDRRIAERITAARLTRRRLDVLVPAALVGLSALAGLVDPVASWLVVFIAVAVTLLIKTPVRPLLLTITFFALAVDNPRSIPANGNWEAPWLMIGGALYRNLDPLPVCLLDIMAAACAVRGLFHIRTESRVRIDRERIFARMVAVSILTLGFTFLTGILRGGDLKQAVYQSRVMFWIPCFAIAIATVGDMPFLRRLKNVLLLAGSVKALTGLWVYATVTPKSAKSPLDFVTTHGDSVTYSMVFSVVIAGWVAGVHKRQRAWHWAALFLTLAGLYTNQRRIAFVAMAFGLLLMYQDMIPSRRRMVNRTASRFLIPFVLYLAVAFTGISQASIFRPALSLRSVVIQDDDSSSTRDIENFNLYFTYKSNPVLGTGFGHEYIELVQADYIGDVFPQYRFLPHNSLLGLFAYGGMIAGMGYYVLFPSSIYLALRASKRRYTPERWMYSMLGASGIAAVLIQGFGDVGFHDQLVGVTGGIAVGICGALYCSPDEEPTRIPEIDERAAYRLDGPSPVISGDVPLVAADTHHT
jgi:hypothetical protein